MRLLIILLFFSVVEILAQQQKLSTHSRLAEKMYVESLDCMNKQDFQGAIDKLNKAVEADPKFIEGFLLMSDAYSTINDNAGAIKCYQKAIEIDPTFFPPAYYYQGELYAKQGNYAEALNDINLFLATGKASQRLQIMASRIKSNCTFAIDALKHPVSFNPENIGSGVNTKYDEYWPSISIDNQTIIFTRLLPKNPNIPISYQNCQEDLFSSNFDNNQWSTAKELGSPINTSDNEGTQTLSSDGNVMFFTACNRTEGLGSCDIYFSFREGDKWSKPVNVGEPVNSKFKETQPSLGSDGRTLYFASNRPGGKGNMDIWRSSLQEDGKWSQPVNLGDSINTPYDEQSPYIHSDNKTLYFSSDGWPGMGGFDIFLSRQTGENKWSAPQNLGYPINSYKDEYGLVVNSEGTKAYYSSNRDPQKGRHSPSYYFGYKKFLSCLLNKVWFRLTFDEFWSGPTRVLWEQKDKFYLLWIFLDNCQELSLWPIRVLC